MKRKILPLKEDDFVKVLFSDFKGTKEGSIMLQENGEILNDGKYKVDFHNGFVGWFERKNIRIIKRSKLKE